MNGHRGSAVNVSNKPTKWSQRVLDTWQRIPESRQIVWLLLTVALAAFVLQVLLASRPWQELVVRSYPYRLAFLGAHALVLAALVVGLKSTLRGAVQTAAWRSTTHAAFAFVALLAAYKVLAGHSVGSVDTVALIVTGVGVIAVRLDALEERQQDKVVQREL